MSTGFQRLLLLLLCVIAGLLLWQHQSRVFEDKGRLQIARQGSAVVLSWHHEIDVPMQRRIEEAYASWRDETDTFILDLNSPGGALREGNRVIEMLKRLKQTHRLVTRVGPRSHCLSMCVPIYLQGQSRLAAASSNWMFHEPRSVNYFTGEDEDGPEVERRYFAERFFDRYFTNSEIAPRWRDALRAEWVGKDIWKSGQQLVDEGSNIITSLY